MSAHLAAVALTATYLTVGFGLAVRTAGQMRRLGYLKESEWRFGALALCLMLLWPVLVAFSLGALIVLVPVRALGRLVVRIAERHNDL